MDVDLIAAEEDGATDDDGEEDVVHV